MQTVSFSELQTSEGGYLGKAYTLVKGKCKSLKPKNLWQGSGKTIHLDFDKMPEYLSTLDSNCILVSGIARQSKYKISIKKLLSDADSNTITRSKQFFNWSETDTGAVFLDCDSETLKPKDTLAFLKNVIETATSGNPDFAHIIKSSSSAHIYHTETNQLLTNNSKHHTIIMGKNMQHLPIFLNYLFNLAWIKGYGWIMISEGAAMLPRGVFDVALGSPSQPIFAAPPHIIGNGLISRPPNIFYQSGNMLDLSKFKSDSNMKRQAKIAIEKAKNNPDVRKALAAKRDERITALAKQHNINESKAKQILDKRIEGELSIDDILYFDDGEAVEVKEVLSDPYKYDNRSLSDPLEQDAGSCKAMFFANNNNPTIHSFLHGGRIFKFDAVEFANFSATKIIDNIGEKDEADEIIFAENMLKHMSKLKKKDPAKYRKLTNKIKDQKIGKVEFRQAVNDFDKANSTNNSTDALRALISNRFELFHDPQKNAYAKDITEFGQQIYFVDSKMFRQVVTHIAQTELKWTISPASVTTVVHNIESEAVRNGEEENVYNRCAYYNSTVYLDIADNTGKAIKIDADGWQVITHPPVNFISTPSMKSFPVPIQGGTLDDLFEFFPVDQEEQIFILSWMLHSWFKGKSQPILELLGVPGSGKTTLAKFIRQLVDPTVLEISTLPDRRDAFAPLYKAQHIVAFDNVRTISDFVSDQLCVRATGGFDTSRELYSNSEVHAVDISGPTILTSVNSAVIHSDLKDRTVSIQLKQFIKGITGRERQTEESLNARFDAVHGKLFGILLDLLVKVMKKLPEIHNKNLPRMADFCKTGAALCNMCLDEDPEFFFIKYNQMQSIQNSQILVGNKACVKIMYLLHQQPDRWENGILASDLLGELQRVRLKYDRGYDLDSDIGSVRKLAKMLKYMTASFDAVGVEIYHEKVKAHGKVRYHIKLRLDNELKLIIKDVEFDDDMVYREFIEKAFESIEVAFIEKAFESLVNASV